MPKSKRPSGPGGGQRQLHVRLKQARKHRPSSQRWLERQLNDPYVKRAQAEGHRFQQQILGGVARLQVDVAGTPLCAIFLDRTLVDCGKDKDGWRVMHPVLADGGLVEVLAGIVAAQHGQSVAFRSIVEHAVRRGDIRLGFTLSFDRDQARSDAFGDERFAHRARAALNRRSEVVIRIQ